MRLMYFKLSFPLILLPRIFSIFSQEIRIFNSPSVSHGEKLLRKKLVTATVRGPKE